MQFGRHDTYYHYYYYCCYYYGHGHRLIITTLTPNQTLPQEAPRAKQPQRAGGGYYNMTVTLPYPFCGSYLESYRVILKKKYYGALE